MPEKIINRTEHSRSLEDAERYRALDFLKEIGLLTSVNDIETYHGRAGEINQTESWKVDSHFQNGGNDSRNHNINKRPTLYTSEDKRIALDFAETRTRVHGASNHQAEIHRIVSADPDATIIDTHFDWTKLDKEAVDKYQNALSSLRIPITEGAPLDFNERNFSIKAFRDEVAKKKTALIERDEVADIANEAGVNKDAALKLSGAYNASNLISFGALPTIVNKMISSQSDVIDYEIGKDEDRITVPLNIEYIQKFLREAHIVGAKQYLWSATLDKDIESISFFDLEKINSEKGIEESRSAVQYRLGALAIDGIKTNQEAKKENELLRLLDNVYAKPHKLVEAAKKVSGFESIFNADAGNWEGFTLAEHTETVLRNFDENFADNIPVQLISPTRLALIAHDLGKPVAVARGEKRYQHKYNQLYADDFLIKLGIDEKQKILILAIIGEGVDIINRVYVKDKKISSESDIAMKSLAQKTLKEVYGTDNVDRSMVGGFIDMCRMLFVCDGGAYTDMATTRTKNGYHRNAPSFNGTFLQPTSHNKQSLKLPDINKS